MTKFLFQSNKKLRLDFHKKRKEKKKKKKEEINYIYSILYFLNYLCAHWNYMGHALMVSWWFIKITPANFLGPKYGKQVGTDWAMICAPKLIKEVVRLSTVKHICFDSEFVQLSSFGVLITCQIKPLFI